MDHEQPDVRIVSGREAGFTTQGCGGNHETGQRAGTPLGGIKEFLAFSASARRSSSTSGKSVWAIATSPASNGPQRNSAQSTAASLAHPFLVLRLHF